ncbi:MAG: hypothetical protein LUD43_00335 [Firmicutes bacterium]|nr:hypothetical protein [Bacillota bacterium]
MKRTFSILLILAMAFTLAASVSAQTITPSEEYFEAVSARGEAFGEAFDYVLLMDNFMLSNNTVAIFKDILSDSAEIPSYTVSYEDVPLGEKFYTLSGFEKYFDADIYADRYALIESLSSEFIDTECIIVFNSEKTSYYVMNSAKIESEAFDIINSDLREYILNFETMQSFYDFMGSEGETLTFDEGETTSGSYVYWFDEPRAMILKETPYAEYDEPSTYDEWVEAIESGATYQPYMPGEQNSDGLSVFTDSSSTVRFVYNYSIHSAGVYPYSNEYHMILHYSEPENEDDRNDYSKYTLESVTFYEKPDSELFDEEIIAPQTGSGAALLTFLAVASLGIACRVKKRAR